MKTLLAKQNWRSKVGWETIFYFYQKWVDRNFSIISKLWHSESFAGIAKISLCRSEIHCSPIMYPAASVPLATVTYILQLAILFPILFLLRNSSFPAS